MKWLLLFCLATSQVSAQTPGHTFITDSVRAFLAQEWDTHTVDLGHSERAYCVTYKTFTHNVWGTWLFVVTGIRKASIISSGRLYVHYSSCKDGEATIHSHTNSTCLPDTGCVLGGIEAHVCEESDIDRATLAKSNMPFAGIQCDRNAVSFHYHPLLKPKKPPAKRPAT